MTATSPTTSRSGLLRFAMRLDAVLVGLTGIPFVAAGSWLASLTGIPAAMIYGLGVFFGVYGVGVYWLAGRPNPRPGGIATIAANAAFTVFFAAEAILGVWPLTGWGVAILLGGALYTAVIGAVQYLGLRRLA